MIKREADVGIGRRSILIHIWPNKESAITSDLNWCVRISSTPRWNDKCAVICPYLRAATGFTGSDNNSASYVKTVLVGCDAWDCSPVIIANPVTRKIVGSCVAEHVEASLVPVNFKIIIIVVKVTSEIGICLNVDHAVAKTIYFWISVD